MNETSDENKKQVYDVLPSAAASLARRSISAQSFFVTDAAGASHEPPTQATLGSAK